MPKHLDNELNEIYYETGTLEPSAKTIAQINQFSLGTLYLLWAMEASQVSQDKNDPDMPTLDIYACFCEEFFDHLNDEVQKKTIEQLRHFADALESRGKM